MRPPKSLDFWTEAPSHPATLPPADLLCTIVGPSDSARRGASGAAVGGGAVGGAVTGAVVAAGAAVFTSGGAVGGAVLGTGVCRARRALSNTSRDSRKPRVAS